MLCPMMGNVFYKLKESRYAEQAFGFAVLIGVGVLAYRSVNLSFLQALDFTVIYTYRVALLKGLGITLVLTSGSVIVGFVTGITLAILYQVPVAPLRWLITVHVEIWRNTPLLIQLFWVHFALPMLTGVSTTVFVSGILTMSLQASAYLTEIARAGIDAVPKGQWEAAYALGIPARTRWLVIILPQAMKIMIPPLAGTVISFFKASTVLSIFAVGELMTVANTVGNYTFKPIEVLTFVGAVYLVLGYIFSNLTYKLENMLSQSER